AAGARRGHPGGQLHPRSPDRAVHDRRQGSPAFGHGGRCHLRFRRGAAAFPAAGNLRLERRADRSNRGPAHRRLRCNPPSDTGQKTAGDCRYTRGAAEPAARDRDAGRLSRPPHSSIGWRGQGRGSAGNSPQTTGQLSQGCQSSPTNIRGPVDAGNPERAPVPRDRGEEPPTANGKREQVAVRLQHESRAAHTAQCHHRADRDDGQQCAALRNRKGAGAAAAREPRWDSSPWPHQPGARPVEDRSRKARVHPTNRTASTAINEVIGTAGQLAEKNKNRLVVDAQENLGVLTVDPMRLRQILLNLLSNACKFTKQGEVKLQARKVANGGNWIELAVVDTGM